MLPLLVVLAPSLEPAGNKPGALNSQPRMHLAVSLQSDHATTLPDVPGERRSVSQRKTRHNVQLTNFSELF